MSNFSKDFNKWNELKKKLNIRDEEILFHEREIWWCSIGLNIGFEEDGKNKLFERPILVIKKFNKYVLWVLPLTRSKKSGGYYYRITQGDEDDSVIILSQLRLISSKRLLRKMRMIKKSEFKEITEKVKEFLK
ncbi:MAG: type II toxin-antitoxin system PemK/MazF family toxin [Candidatus Staskawiczbacteria bacterium]|nr:type II toxin-antitoxin system PemK/MazF family toxin [Candidatus Staskawiczbacteria bacterium]